MILGFKGHNFHVYMKNYDFETRTTEKEARLGRISKSCRIVGARSAEQSVVSS